MTALTFAVMATKHPGFREEKEWRLVYRKDSGYLPIFQQAEESFRGFSQSIYKVPLKNRPELGLRGIEIRDIVDRIIIGPSDKSSDLREQFVSLLSAKGVPSPSEKVFSSDIPFRRIISPP